MFIKILSKSNITNKQKLISIIYLVLIVFIYLIFYGINFEAFESLGSIFLILLTAILVFVIHELIHIVLFKILGKGKAKIKIIYDKELGAIAIYQCNKDVKYSIFNVLIILLTPMILLTFLGIILINLTTNDFLIELLRINVILNLLGSHLDFLISVLLVKLGNKNEKISFDYNSKEGMIMIMGDN